MSIKKNIIILMILIGAGLNVYKYDVKLTTGSYLIIIGISMMLMLDDTLYENFDSVDLTSVKEFNNFVKLLVTDGYTIPGDLKVKGSIRAEKDVFGSSIVGSSNVVAGDLNGEHSYITRQDLVHKVNIEGVEETRPIRCRNGFSAEYIESRNNIDAYGTISVYPNSGPGSVHIYGKYTDRATKNPIRLSGMYGNDSSNDNRDLTRLLVHVNEFNENDNGKLDGNIALFNPLDGSITATHVYTTTENNA